MDGELKLSAGGSGFTFTAGEEFVWRTIGDSVIGANLGAVMERTLIAGFDQIAPPTRSALDRL